MGPSFAASPATPLQLGRLAADCQKERREGASLIPAGVAGDVRGARGSGPV